MEFPEVQVPSSGGCAQSAPVTCTATTTATPTPTPTGTCAPRCPDYSSTGGLYISEQVNTTAGVNRFYPTSCSTEGLGYHLCQYNVWVLACFRSPH